MHICLLTKSTRITDETKKSKYEDNRIQQKLDSNNQTNNHIVPKLSTLCAHNSGQGPHNSGQNLHNAGKGAIFGGA